ncbi:MAG: hypothetical protein ABSA67_18805 [Candidatus Brocadiia bacterium]|jgi:hypothetical protein
MSKRLMFVMICLLGSWFACAGHAAPPNPPATQPEPGPPADALKSARQSGEPISAATSASVVSPDALDAPPGPAPAKPPVSAGHAFTDLRFTQDCPMGAQDDRGQWIAGTETMRLVQHQGKLFASVEVWTDRPYFQGKGEQPWTGSEILVKESASAPWRLDRAFPRVIRLAAMTSATFIKDASGGRLDPPVTLLIASPSSPNSATWTRDDASGKWNASMIQEGLRGGLRSFCTHVDAVTQVQYLFGGAGAARTGSIFRAVYDPAAPGRIRWNEAPELSGTGRVMCMAEANGVLYAACGIISETASSGGLFRRVDGEKPTWELLWRWPHKIQEQGDEMEIMRGLTAIPDPKGGAHQVLLGTCNYPGVVYRIDPSPKLEVTTELDIHAYFAKAFGVPALRGPCLSAYNNFLPVTDPDTGEKVHLFGVWINPPGGHGTDLGRSAWYLIRHSDGSYGHGRVFDPDHPRPNPPRGLLSTRTIEVSPFPEDKGRTLYFGGYDPANIDSHNTAWIYKAALRPVESKKEGR